MAAHWIGWSSPPLRAFQWPCKSFSWWVRVFPGFTGSCQVAKSPQAAVNLERCGEHDLHSMVQWISVPFGVGERRGAQDQHAWNWKLGLGAARINKLMPAAPKDLRVPKGSCIASECSALGDWNNARAKRARIVFLSHMRVFPRLILTIDYQGPFNIIHLLSVSLYYMKPQTRPRAHGMEHFLRISFGNGIPRGMYK